jgi:hypothetical protein
MFSVAQQPIKLLDINNGSSISLRLPVFPVIPSPPKSVAFPRSVLGALVAK